MKFGVFVGRWLVVVDVVVGTFGLWEDGMFVVWNVFIRFEGLEIEIVLGVGVLKVELVLEEIEGRNVFGGDVI